MGYFGKTFVDGEDKFKVSILMNEHAEFEEEIFPVIGNKYAG